MARKFSEIRDRILPICPSRDYEKISDALKNPIKHPCVIDMLEQLLARVDELNLTTRNLNEIKTILEDDIVEMRVICQNAKCDPFNYLSARRLDHRS